MTLTEFLLAQIAEDEALALAAQAQVGAAAWRAGEEDYEGIDVWPSTGDDYGHETDTTVHIARHDPARVLAECEAKRRIVERMRRTEDRAERFNFDGGYATAVSDCLLDLALPYADHPDYREEWRP